MKGLVLLVLAAVCFASTQGKGLVLGVYDGVVLTQAAAFFNNQTSGKLAQALAKHGAGMGKGSRRVFYDLSDKYTVVTVVGLGSKDQGYNEIEEMDEMRESIRIAMAAGAVSLRGLGEKEVEVDSCGDAEAAAVGVVLALHSYDELKAASKRQPQINVACYAQNLNDTKQWTRGVTLAEGQNLARRLAEMPANYLTPIRFGEIAAEEFNKTDNVKMIIRDRAWAEEMKMGSFLSVNDGSLGVTPAVFLDIHYKGGKDLDLPLALVGKGITFDTGGISIKPSSNMDKMRGDMGGAAVVMGAMTTIAKLKLPINVRAFIPLTDNMPSGSATHPGDVVTAMNGKTIQVDNTDAEGRLIMADALCYAETFEPKAIVDVATLTGAMVSALGPVASGAFTDTPALWNLFHEASGRTGDRLWRMPLWKYHTMATTRSQLADVNNIATGGSGSSTAAAFLKEFVSKTPYLHVDMASVMGNTGTVPYMVPGMSGRPTRTLVEFIALLSKQGRH